MSDIYSYEWKDQRMSSNRNERQVKIKMMDMTMDQLQYCYNTCKDMLFNSDPKLPGRMIVLNKIAEQRNACNAERCLRWFIQIKDHDGNYQYPNAESLMTYLRIWEKEFNANDNTFLGEFLEVPSEFKHVKVSMLEQACRDALGAFDHSKISFSFIYDLGIYLTQEEMKEIDNDLRAAKLNPDAYTLQAKIDNHIKVPLGITGSQIRINPRGLTIKEFKDMINMKHYKGYKMCKYSALSTAQLTTLVTKVLYALEAKVKVQASGWTERMRQIEEIANYKGFSLE